MTVDTDPNTLLCLADKKSQRGIHDGPLEYALTNDIHGRNLVITEKDHLGLAPRSTKAGDEVCVLLGCNSATILQRTKKGHHRVVRGSYVQGFMEGGALLGDLEEY